MQLIDTLKTLLETGEKIEQINKLTLKLFAINVAALKENAFETFVEPGDIRFVKEYEIKAAVFDMYTMYDRVQLTDQLALQQYNSYFYPYLLKNMDTYSYSVQPIEKFNSPEFKNNLDSYDYFLSRQRGIYEYCLKQTNEFLAVLQR